MGGPAAGGTSSAARKAYSRRVNAVHTYSKKTKTENEISFSDADLDNRILPHDDALKMMIGDDRLKPANSDLFGFSGEVVKVEGQIELPVLVGEPPCQAFTTVNFLVVRATSVYNAILGRPSQNLIRAVTSAYHQKMKFITPNGVGEVRGDQPQSRECYAMALKGKNAVESLPIELLDLRDEFRGTQSAEDLIPVSLSLDDNGKVIQIGSSLSSSIQHHLTEFLQDNADVFAWAPVDMPDIDPEISTHRLGVDSTCRPMKQKRRHFAFEKRQAIKEEVERLLKADFIREIQYPDWLANVVLDHVSDLRETFQVLKKHSMKLNPSKCTFGVGSAVLVREEHRQQRPIYYISKVLHDAEIRYQRVEKLAYALVVAARKLRPYFQAHTIKVLTDQPLRQVLHRPDISGRLVKWAMELSEFDIQYVPRPAIKAQVLADFVAECTIPQQITESEVAQTPVVEKSVTSEERAADGTETEIVPTPAEQDLSAAEPIWEVYVDGSSNKGGCGAEYEALLAGMNLAVQVKAQRLRTYCDSQLVANQIQGVYEARDERMVKYLSKVRRLASKFQSFEVIRIPRTENAKADVLSKLAASGYTTLRSICMEFLQKSSIESEAAEVMQVEHDSCWMDEIIDYLRNGKLPEAKKEARKVIQRAARFSLSDESLYKRSYTLPYLKCLRPGDAAYTLQETHEGICGEHLGGKALISAPSRNPVC
ncbi:uncharacterized protein LOC143855806 [Tasmannia lanceolata]|uniref:uncharacterized protein LOC143855806 n=1 Tax=Tasmannia lanceolata TaxID=3420 RepID=UPI00406315C0